MLKVSGELGNEKHLQDIFHSQLYQSILPDIFSVIETKTFIQKDVQICQQLNQWLRCFIFPNENQHYILLIFDITEERNRKNKEELLIAKKEKAEKQSKTKSNFLAMLSHEIRTPLNSVMGFVQILLDDKEDPLTAKQRIKMKKIGASSKQLLKLINNILELVRMDNSSLDNKSKKYLVNIRKVVDECFQTNQELAKEKHLSLEIEKSAQDIEIEIDSIRFRQVLENLLINAIKYNVIGGQISVYWRVDGRDLAIFVKDTGVGIPDTYLESIFEPFFRVLSKENEIEGTGIGLTLVKQNVQEMNGTLGVYSKQGEGSTFWVKVPVSTSEGKELPLSEAN
ncbi:Sensor histidine kinase RcsC [Bacillus sp. THAF10]|nr:Sensor histidine kinase RcsC [Bacillus sp. THAF10]